MIQYETIEFKGEETFNYRLTRKVIYATGENLGYWNLVTPEGEVVVKCRGSIVSVLEGYMWDGTTVMGSHYEDDVTLEASLIHDVLYNAAKNPDDIKVPFSLWTADAIFADYLERIYRRKGSFFQRWVMPTIYKWGLWTVGTPWKFGNNKYYKLEKA